MNLPKFRRLYGQKGAIVAGKRVKNPPTFDERRRLCRLCTEPLVRARVESLLLDGQSFCQAEKLTGVSDNSIIRHARLCLDPETQTAIEAARRAKRYSGTKPKPLIMPKSTTK
jgi:hypothetical protein